MIYGVKFFKNGEEVDISEIPRVYLNGLIQICREENNQEERFMRVVMEDNI